MPTEWTLHDFVCMTLGAAAYHQGIGSNPKLMLDGIVVCNVIMRERTGDPDWGKLAYQPLDYVDLVLLDRRPSSDRTLRIDKVRAGAQALTMHFKGNPIWKG